jgi:hypothetical protein
MATSGWLAKALLAGWLMICLLLPTGCMKQTVESSGQQLTQLGSFYGIQWPANYINDHAGVLRYSARDSANNTIAIVRLEVDEASYRSWYGQITNRMNKYEELAAHVDPMITKRFPWYNPQAYPASQVTEFFCETNARPKFVAQLTVHAVKSTETHILFIHSWISGK